MGDRLKNLSLSFVLLAAIYAVLGLVLLIWPLQVMDALCYLTGGVLLFYGVCAVLTFCALEGVDSVAIYSLGKRLAGPMDESDIVLAE